MENSLRKVRIKTWEEMEREYGLTEFGDMNIVCRWTKEMEELISIDRIIEIDEINYWIEPTEQVFKISEQMIAEYITETSEGKQMENKKIVIKCENFEQVEKVMSLSGMNLFDSEYKEYTKEAIQKYLSIHNSVGIGVTSRGFSPISYYEEIPSYTIKSFAEYITETSEISESENTSAEITQLSQPEINEKPTQSEINKQRLSSLSENNHHIHYLKWNITDNLSIRYFYNFQDRLEVVGKFTIKNHKQKELVVISEETAREFINLYNSEFEEIIGYNMRGKKLGYRKLIMKNGEVSEIFETFNDKIK